MTLYVELERPTPPCMTWAMEGVLNSMFLKERQHMNSIVISLVSFVCMCLGIVVGSLLQSRLPEHHLSEASKDAVKVGTGFIATLTALVLGLLVTSAKSSYDAVNTAVMQNGAKVLALDRALAEYGGETKEIRLTLRNYLARMIQRWWPEEGIAPEVAASPEAKRNMSLLHDGIQKLSPKDDTQKWLKDQAMEMSGDLSQSRSQLLEQVQISLPMPMLVVLVSWLMVLFACFSLLSPRNITVVGVLLLCALSAAGAIFLVIEMCHPETGVMKVSSAPLLKVYAILAK